MEDPMETNGVLLVRLQDLGQLRHDLEQVALETVVGNLKDWSLLILIDGNDHLTILHTGWEEGERERERRKWKKEKS